MIRIRRSTYLSRSSQPGGSMSSFGAMALWEGGQEECQPGGERGVGLAGDAATGRAATKRVSALQR